MKTTTIKEQTKWVPPEGGGAPLLTMPNIPKPLHGLAPRTVMGDYEWGKVRKQCYADAHDLCEICGMVLSGKRGPGLVLHEAHEAYETDYETYTSTFIRPICVCGFCHRFIHSGRAITCYLNHEPLWTKEYMLTIAEHGFSLIDQWNRQHPDDEPLRVYETMLSWVDEPSLHDEMQELIDKYHIEFWGAPHRKIWDNSWGKWKLVYKDTEYYSPYQTPMDWERAMTPHGDKPAPEELFAGEEFEELRKNIKEVKSEV